MEKKLDFIEELKRKLRKPFYKKVLEEYEKEPSSKRIISSILDDIKEKYNEIKKC